MRAKPVAALAGAEGRLSAAEGGARLNFTSRGRACRETGVRVHVSLSHARERRRDRGLEG